MHTASRSPLRLLTGLSAVGLASAAAHELATDTISFAPATGSTATRTFSETTTLQLESAAMKMGDMERDMGDLRIDLKQARVVTVTDTYGASADDAPRALRRAYDEVSLGIVVDVVTPEGDEESADIESSHDLEGHDVVFEWNDELGESEPRFAEDDAADEDLLEDITVDMDLTSLLVPAEDAGEGSRWNVDASAFLALTRPGGIGAVPFEVGDDEDEVGVYLTCLLSCRDGIEDVEGDVEISWKNTREIDGVRCAVGDIDVEIVGSADVIDRILGDLADALPCSGQEMEFMDEAVISIELAGEGEFVWNLEENRLHTVELDLENSTELFISGRPDGAPEGVELRLELSGDSVLEVSGE